MHDTARRAGALLVALLAATALGTGLAASQGSDDGGASDGYVVEQGEQCTEIEPVSYRDDSVEEFYGYTANASDPGVTYSANTPIDVEDLNEGTSSMFLYEGPEGLSLVVLHGAPNGTAGGAASFQFAGLPEEGDWVVQDDPESESVEQWNRSADGDWTVHWGWQYRYTDGGAYHGGLDDEFEVQIDPAFNEDARQDPLSEGNVTEWRVMSGDWRALEAVALDMDEPATVRSGTCE